jgi:hypothetical protein
MNDCARSRETTQTQIGACGFMELNDGNAPLQSTALLLDAVPGVDPDTVTLSPDVGIGKLVDPLTLQDHGTFAFKNAFASSAHTCIPAAPPKQ